MASVDFRFVTELLLFIFLRELKYECIYFVSKQQKKKKIDELELLQLQHAKLSFYLVCNRDHQAATSF